MSRGQNLHFLLQMLMKNVIDLNKWRIHLEMYIKTAAPISLCVVCNYSYFSNSGGINFACRLIMLAVQKEWILCWTGGLWVFTRSGESKALFN